MIGFASLFQRARRGGARPPWRDEEEPLRAELFSAQQLAQHGAVLARRHKPATGRAHDTLLARLALNERVLSSAARLLGDAIRGGHAITPAGEWLLDNYYLIDENIRTARRHLPKGYSRELPRLADGASADLPRVYDIALEAISHGDGRLVHDALTRFIAAYQTQTPLTLGELWALPIMLRLALIENLRRVAARIASGRVQRNLANQWADQMIAVAEGDPKNLILVVADMARSKPPTTSAFVAELSRRLKGHGHALTLPLTWVEQHLAESGLSIEQLVQAENQQQAADQVSISNSIGSLRELAVTDWSDFVEALSLTEKTLRGDPAGVYALMDFATRDHYRHVVERLARRSGKSEDAIARRAVAFAHFASADYDEHDCRTHVGYYLVDAGLRQLESAVGIDTLVGGRELSYGERALRFFAAIGALTVALVVLFVAQAHALHAHAFVLALVALCAALAGSQLAVTVVNRVATMLVRPALLPRLDFAAGIPPAFRTLVVVPALLRDEAGIARLVEGLEVRFLGNRDEQLRFALLSDFADAADPVLPHDERFVQAAATAIARLNAKYRKGHDDVFFLLHRPRRWNEREGVWMGRERKRGKLADLNALLLENRRDSFSHVEGDLDALAGVRYVITLDSDTQLPRDAARKLVAVIAHPLNRAIHDPHSRRIAVGYGILQPRVATTLSSAQRTRYARLHAGNAGVDPYTRSVSDVYQDVFGEGSFIGKGIYDIAAFEAVMRGAFPDNRVLSHDLLEGCYARSALVSDVELYEDQPARYLSDAARRQRWIRGDWQVAPWLLARVRNAAGERERNPLSALSQWKIFDNLRRSVAPVALIALLLAGWLWLGAGAAWTASALAVALLPALGASAWDLANRTRGASWRQHLRLAVENVRTHCTCALFDLARLPHEAWISVDAIARTLARMLVTRRHLLQWTPFSEVERRSDATLHATLRQMWPCPLLALAALGATAVLAPQAVTFVAPVAALWLLAPLWAWRLSEPVRDPRDGALNAGERLFLRSVARRTWAFFERWADAEDNALPPDNVQEVPQLTVAHRTSPTNMGLGLLAALAAHDLGYIGTGALLARTAATLDTLRRLERERGHFYNWYDTRTLHPLHPLYLSTVDNGNLAAHLLVLQAGLLEVARAPLVADTAFAGLRDAWNALRAETAAMPADLVDAFERDLLDFETDPPRSAAALFAALARAHALALEFERLAPRDEAGAGAAEWSATLARQSGELLDDLRGAAVWLALPSPPERLRAVVEAIELPALDDVGALGARVLAKLGVAAADAGAAEREWIGTFEAAAAASAEFARERIAAIRALAAAAETLAQVDFGIFYDADKRLFSIGYNASERRLDAACYDLLASEARLATFFAIAHGQIPQDSWYALGRLLAQTPTGSVLMSWSGSMFEYLMPLLVAPSYAGSLLAESCAGAVRRQIAYGRERGVPWGISESGYSVVDAAQNYQYRAFGVPGLGLKRGLAEDLVVAPYACALALMLVPRESQRNLARLAAGGMFGRYGFYEARDYTPARLRRGETSTIVQSFMAHHQGMTLLALDHVLCARPMQRRFCAVPQFRATLHLLQERIPRVAVVSEEHTRMVDVRALVESGDTPIRIYETGDTPTPAVQLLSNGRYHVMLTNAGGGYSRWRDYAVTRWREDPTCDPWGAFCFVRDVASGRAWSVTWQPLLSSPDLYEAIFTESHVEYRRHDGPVDTHVDVAVSPEDDIELRRVRLVNRTRAARVVEITTYAEPVLAPPPADAAQRGFGNLFVQTELMPARDAIVCTRRARSQSERPPWLLHVVRVRGAESAQTSFETDRARFLGRGNGLRDAAALAAEGPLSGSAGSVLDPIVAVRHRVSIEPDHTVTIDIVTGVAEQREACLALVDKYQDKALADRVFDLAWTHSQVALRQINVTEADAQLYGRMASRILYANASLRADAALIAANRRNQTGLWGYAISGDLPILLLRIRDLGSLPLARQLVQAHAYWRMKGMMVDLVIWNDERGGYRQALHDQIMGLIAATIEGNVVDRPGGIFVRPVDQISPDDRVLLQAAARVIISDQRGALAEQVRLRDTRESGVPRFAPVRTGGSAAAVAMPELSAPQLLANGSGGFNADGSEYVITTGMQQRTPLPWANVIANPHFGSVISESGSAYTWAENAHEFRLTPWHDDPVGDPTGEAFYLRDEETGEFWSPAPAPACGKTPYVTRHGFGYSVFEHVENAIHSELWIYVDANEPVKYCVLKMRNLGAAPRKLSATGYVEWVLGDLRPKSALHIVSEMDPNSGALLAHNAYNPEFPGRVAFFDVDDPRRTLTCDRGEFVGRNGDLKSPRAMRRAHLSGRTGAAMDPCAAIQVPFELAEGKARDVIFRIGAAHSPEEASARILHLRRLGTARDALAAVRAYWQRLLGAVRVTTPDASLNLLANGWLLYQVISARLHGRSGYYQSGGAFGFRDQLQDAMGLVHCAPELLRAQLLLCASRQFVQGDVQHWWHPPSGRGVRTRCSDDYLWLPYAACRYVETSGDAAVLDETAPFLEGRPLGADEESYYDLPGRSERSATLYEHCRLAIEHGLRFGAHGIPLIGSGDWNDGMNNVGIHGKGESVWLGFFLYDVLERFAPLAAQRGDAAFAGRCGKVARKLRDDIERNAWDGEWYRRAWFDDGTPLGSAQNAECRIDSISQSWAALSGAGGEERVAQALRSLDAHLIDRDAALIKLLAPPFDASGLDPGYIKGYVPGVRENGGQYTHAAIWAAMAFAHRGDAQRAYELFGMIDPLRHADTRDRVAVYKVEPYVVAADVYAVEPHVGRGGWTWYTGSAGWLYRLIVEALLGIRREGGRLRLAAAMPPAWSDADVEVRAGASVYRIELRRHAGVAAGGRARLDGVELGEPLIELVDDGAAHAVRFELPP